MFHEEPTQSHKFIQRQEVTVTKSLDLLESNADELEGPVSAGQIAVACALAYRDFRFSEIEWRLSRPKLSQWFESFYERASMQDTIPE